MCKYLVFNLKKHIILQGMDNIDVVLDYWATAKQKAVINVVGQY
jgi:hypothetical protein